MRTVVRKNRNAIWATVGTGSQVVSQILAIVILARILTPLEFGVASTATLIIQFIVIFCDFGVATFIVQRINLNRTDVGAAKSIVLIATLSCVFIVATVSPYIAALLQTKELELVLKAYTIQLVLLGISGVHDARIQRDMDYKYLAMADSISFSVGYFAISVICGYLGLSYWSLVVGHISQSLIRLAFILAKSEGIFFFSFSKPALREITFFGCGQTLSRMGSFLSSQADSYIVSSRLGIEAMGVYGRANQLATIPAIQIGQLFDKLLFPALARRQEDSQKSSDTYLKALKLIMLVCVPPSVLLYLMAPDIVPIILGPNWIEAAEPMKILALAIPFRLLHKVSDPTARAMGETYSRAWRQWLVALTLLLFAFALSEYGLSGIAYAVVIAAILDATMLVSLCASATKTKPINIICALTPAVFAGLAMLSTTLIIIELGNTSSIGSMAKLALCCVACAIVVLSFATSFQVFGAKDATH